MNDDVCTILQYRRITTEKNVGTAPVGEFSTSRVRPCRDRAGNRDFSVLLRVSTIGPGCGGTHRTRPVFGRLAPALTGTGRRLVTIAGGLNRGIDGDLTCLFEGECQGNRGSGPGHCRQVDELQVIGRGCLRLTSRNRNCAVRGNRYALDELGLSIAPTVPAKIDVLGLRTVHVNQGVPVMGPVDQGELSVGFLPALVPVLGGRDVSIANQDLFGLSVRPHGSALCGFLRVAPANGDHADRSCYENRPPAGPIRPIHDAGIPGPKTTYTAAAANDCVRIVFSERARRERH